MKTDASVERLVGSYGDWWKNGFEIPEMTSNLFPYTKMFEPIKINKVTIKNRLVMAPMGNISMCEETGRPNAKMLKYFEARAKGGVGLITSGLIPISYGIDKSLIELGNLSYFPRIDRSRTVFAAWRDLAGMCHDHGAKFFIQLTPGLGRVGNPQCLVTQLKFPRSASFNPNWYMKDVPCLRLSDHAMGKIIKKAGQASADAKAANIDGVYLHGHEGYLLEQCTNPAFNRRKLGKYANYERFGIDMIKEIRKRVGPDYPIMYRIDLTLALNETYKDRMNKQSPLKKFKNGRTISQTLSYMKHLVKAGVDMFDVDMGCYDNWWLPHPPSSMPSGCFLDLSLIAKKYFAENNIVSNFGLPVPIVGVGKLGYPDFAEKALRDEKCDMVMLGRPLLADPEWPNKVYANKIDDIIPCIGCQEGCLNEFVEGGHPQCAVNPRTAFEEEYSEEIPEAKIIKNIAIIGAGPAGVVAAQVLIQRGHQVTLFEKENEVGGQLLASSKIIIKYEVKNYANYLAHQVKKLVDSGKLVAKFGHEVTAQELIDAKFDSIMVSTGAHQAKLKVEGIDGKNVFSAIDVLKNPALLKDANNIVIVGGGVVGAETAYMLAYEHDKKVTVIEMDKFIMNHTCTANRGHIIHYLEEKGGKFFVMTKLLKIEPNKVIVSQNVDKNVPDPYNTWAPILPENITNPLEKKIKDNYLTKEISCDAVVMATGVVSNSALYFDLVKNNAAPEINLIGDAFKGGKVHQATRSAYRKARNI
jgi:2-enoate reductase